MVRNTQQVLITSKCDPVSEPNEKDIRSFRCGYDFIKSDVVERSNNKFKIKSDDLRSSNLIKSIFNNLFDVRLGLGWHYLCYHNEKSIFYFPSGPTNLTNPIIFTFYGEDLDDKNRHEIIVNMGQTICEPINTKKDFIVIVNNRIELPTYGEIADYAREHKIEYPNKKYKAPGGSQLWSDIYVKPIWYIVLIKNFLLFIVWSGIVLLFVQIKKFVMHN